MFKILSLDENSFRVEVYFLRLDKKHTFSRAFTNKHDTIPTLRGEWLHFLVSETYSLGSRCFMINQGAKGIEMAMQSVETYWNWATMKKDEKGYMWPPPERIMTEWIKVRAWLKVMLPNDKHPEYSQLKEILRNMNEMNDMFLAQFNNKGIITTHIEKIAV